MAGHSQASGPQSGSSGSQQFGSQGTQAAQSNQQPSTGGQQGGSRRSIGAPILIVGIIVLLYLMFFGSGCAPAGSSQNVGSEQTVSTADLTANADATSGEVPGMQRGLFDYLFGFSPSGGYSNSYDSSQYTSAYQIDPNLGQGNPNETWTVLMYLCGSDLESTPTQRGGGQATKNLVELTKANLGQNVKFVVEAGGAKAWQNNVINPRYLSRYTIEDGKMALQDTQPSASMAAESTFADFLKWGTSNFPADHYMLVIWDHGGGSITGVCQDDIYPYDSRGQADSLTLPEMRDAMKKSGAKFDVIGFDTCLMATVETAQILSPYAGYMVASEESEPGAGWDYESWPSWLAAHPGTPGEDLGTVI